jgi:hypothetical protein
MLAAGYDDPIESMGARGGPRPTEENDGHNAGGSDDSGLDVKGPPQDQDVVVAAVRWLLSGVPGGGAQPGPRNR